MSEFDQEKFKKKLKKKIAKQTKKYGKFQINLGSNRRGGTGAYFFLGQIGAAIYFLSHATSFWDGVWGLVKAAAWPATLLFEVFVHLHG